MPATIDPIVARLPQPQVLDSCSPSTVNPMPATKSPAPPQSIRAGCLTSFSFTNANSVSESSATEC